MIKTVGLLALTLIFFASNSILCRLALLDHSIDALSFTLARIISGALVLNILVIVTNGWKYKFTGKLSSALSLLVYALLFSLAYLKLTAATGALILFGCVQSTMIGWSISRGLGPTKNEWIGLTLAVTGLVYFLIPGVKAPDTIGALYMAVAGMGWGAYSIIGKGSKHPVSDTAGNFSLGCLLSIPILVIALLHNHLTLRGIELAVASGAVSSGLGYSIWYTVLPSIKSTQAAIVQLLVPAIAALLATIILNERISTRLVVAGMVIAAGVIITIIKPIKTRTHFTK